MIERKWKCANCGNQDMDSLHSEGDVYYCSVCTHRTVIATGKDDLIVCPYCRHRRDRKAAYCDWCNNQLNLFPKPSRAELKAIREDVRRFEKNLDSSNIRYWNIRGEV